MGACLCGESDTLYHEGNYEQMPELPRRENSPKKTSSIAEDLDSPSQTPKAEETEAEKKKNENKKNNNNQKKEKKKVVSYVQNKAEIAIFWSKNQKLEALISAPNRKRLNRLPEIVSYNYNGVVKDIKSRDPLSLADMKNQKAKNFESSYEKKTEELLKSKGIPFKSEVYIGVPWNCRFDFAISIKGIPVLIEIDGEPHFNRQDFKFANAKYSGGRGSFDEYQNKDCWKTEIALIRGYKVIRIAHFHMDCLEHVLHDAVECLNAGNSLFLSDPSAYKHILRKMQVVSLIRDNTGLAFS